jgi:hypothetical protein
MVKDPSLQLVEGIYIYPGIQDDLVRHRVALQSCDGDIPTTADIN